LDATLADIDDLQAAGLRVIVITTLLVITWAIA